MISPTISNGKIGPKILVLGASGMLGDCVIRYLQQKKFDVVGFTSNILNPLRDSTDLIKDLVEDFDWVINCIGMIRPKEGEELDCFIVNSYFPKVLKQICDDAGIGLIHISTDCVFDGHAGPYFEDSIPNERDVYGLSKYLGEIDGTIRTSIIGIEKGKAKNLLSRFLTECQYGAFGYIDVYWNGITTLTFAKICEHIIEGDIEWEGVIHVASNIVSKYELLVIAKEVFGVDTEITPKKIGLSNKCLVPGYSQLLLKIDPLDVQIRELKEFYGL